MQSAERVLSHEPLPTAVSDRARVLFVDTYRPRIAIFELLFECLNCSTDIVPDAASAISEMKVKAFSGILVNKNLTPDNGLAVALKIREYERQSLAVPSLIIGITPSDGIHDIAICKSAGMDDCISQSAASDYIQNVLPRLLECQMLDPK